MRSPPTFQWTVVKWWYTQSLRIDVYLQFYYLDLVYNSTVMSHLKRVCVSLLSAVTDSGHHVSMSVQTGNCAHNESKYTDTYEREEPKTRTYKKHQRCRWKKVRSLTISCLRLYQRQQPGNVPSYTGLKSCCSRSCILYLTVTFHMKCHGLLGIALLRKHFKVFKLWSQETRALSWNGVHLCESCCFSDWHVMRLWNRSFTCDWRPKCQIRDRRPI